MEKEINVEISKISKNFAWHEFTDSDVAKKKGIRNDITSFVVRDSIKALVTNVLQPLRDAWGKAMKVNSGYRSPVVNGLVGGAPTSQHAKGEAADIHTGGDIESYRMAKLVLKLDLPFDQMILYNTFVHFSHNLAGKQRKQILYNKSYKGYKLE